MKNEVMEKAKNKKEPFYLLNDKIVKKLFTNGSKASEEFLYLIISTVLKIPKEKLKRDFKLLHPEIGLNDKNINSEADLVFENENYYISLEINYNNYKSLIGKNFSYVCILYLRDIKNKKDYKNLKEIYSINIDGFDYFGRNEFIYESELIENKLLKRNLEIHYIDINLEYLQKLGYNDIINKEEIEKACYIFVCQNEEILDRIYGDSYMSEFKKEAEKLSSELDEMFYYDKEKLDQEIAFNNGLTRGIKEGLKEGKIAGAKEKSLEIAKNMLEQKINIDLIEKSTGLSKEEIENIR